MTLTREYLEGVLSYSPDTGNFTWKINSGRAVLGSIAGSCSSFGYWKICINKRRYFAHRLAWMICNGLPPNGMDIDHINGKRDDNRIANLRLATRSQNNMNSTISSRNNSGCKGVCFHRRDKIWHARVIMKGKLVAFKTFKDKQHAIEFVTSERSNFFGSFDKKMW